MTEISTVAKASLLAAVLLLVVAQADGAEDPRPVVQRPTSEGLCPQATDKYFYVLVSGGDKYLRAKDDRALVSYSGSNAKAEAGGVCFQVRIAQDALAQGKMRVHCEATNWSSRTVEVRVPRMPDERPPVCPVRAKIASSIKDLVAGIQPAPAPGGAP